MGFLIMAPSELLEVNKEDGHIPGSIQLFEEDQFYHSAVSGVAKAKCRQMGEKDVFAFRQSRPVCFYQENVQVFFPYIRSL